MTEVWKDIPNYKGLYQVSNTGKVKSLPRVRTNNRNGGGYLTKEKLIGWIQNHKNYKRIVCNLNNGQHKRQFMVHRLVAQSFIPNPMHLPVINHLNSDATDNRVENLEWCTQQQNILHASKNFRNHKLSELQENELVQLYGQGVSSTTITQKYNISKTAILRIVKKYGGTANPVSGNNKYNIDLSELLKDFKMGYSNKELEQKYNCSQGIIATRRCMFKKRGEL